jgi:hypothetical protein
MASKKKAAKKKAAKKQAPKRKAAAPAKKAVKKAAPKRAAKAAPRKAKPAVKKSAKKAAPKKAAPKKPTPKRPAKKSAKPAAPKRASFTPAFNAQRADAHAKDLLLFEMQRARVAVQAALQGVTGGSADRPVREGGWTIREVVLHLIARDKVRLEELDRTLGGESASWTGIEGAEMASINEWHLGELRHLDWDAAQRLLQTKRDELMAALAAVPAEPAAVWSPEHPFGRMLHALPNHDRHHAAQIKRVRTSK